MAIESTTFAGGIRTTVYDTKRIFLFNNETEKGQIANALETDVTYPAGTVMGRIAATNLLAPLTSAATNGSQFPVGILVAETTVPAESTVTATICVSGHVDAALLDLQGSDTLNTVVALRTIRDRIKADTAGVILKNVENLSPTA